MGLKIVGNTDRIVSLGLEKVAGESNRQLRRLQEKAAEETADVASQMAPYKTGDLQDSVIVDRERAGRRIRHVVRFEMPYAIFMHEGVYNLGPGSITKQQGVPHRVGRKFLSRAMNYVLVQRGYFQRARTSVLKAIRSAF